MKIKTKFGNASISSDGYYYISSVKEGNKGKLLHRLIYEDYHKICLLPSVHIHHIDGNKQNNDINNLIMMSKSDHHKLHIDKYNYMKGNNHKLSSMIDISKSHNTTGYFRVSIDTHVRAKQGFTYVYRYYECGKPKKIRSVDIKKLEKKVKSKGLEWIKFDDNEIVENT